MDLECSNCGASMRLEPQLRTATCPYCASPAVVERQASADVPAPTFSLGFTLGQEHAREVVRGWQKSRGIFHDSSIKTGEIDGVKGLYVPAYLYTAVARSNYRADIGENYTETETYTTVENGRTVVRTRTVVKTEWRQLSGVRTAYVADVLVTASRGVPNDELEAIEPYDMRSLRRYSPAMLSGWIAENPTMTFAECLQLARGEALGKVGHALTKFMPGDTQRNLTHQTNLESEAVDMLHVPLWVLAVRHDPKKPPIRVLVNGQTGKVWGKAPLSVIKIVLAVVLVLGLIALGVFLASEYG